MLQIFRAGPSFRFIYRIIASAFSNSKAFPSISYGDKILRKKKQKINGSIKLADVQRMNLRVFGKDRHNFPPA